MTKLAASSNNANTKFAYHRESIEQRKGDNYESLEEYLIDTFNSFLYRTEDIIPLFRTNVENLNEIYLENLPDDARQHYNCSECRHFLNRYGNIVTLDADGNQTSMMFGDIEKVPEIFKKSVEEMGKAVRKANVVDVFYSDKEHLGTPYTIDDDGIKWTHLHVNFPKSMRTPNDPKIKTINAKTAEVHEDFKRIINHIYGGEITLSLLTEALRILETGQLNMSEKYKGIVNWLRNMFILSDKIKDKRLFKNIVWFEVATAPEGFANFKSSMVGSLLEDISDKYSFDQIKARFNDKTKGEVYMRPVAPPSNAAVKRAETLVKALGIEDSLNRRYARLSEIKLFWEPKTEETVQENKGGVFGHLKTKEDLAKPDTPQVNIPPQVITLRKFVDTVVPNAKKIEYSVQPMPSNYFALLTEAIAGSKPILLWDSEEQRNPISYYVYTNGSNPSRWGLTAGKYVEVVGMLNEPAKWNGGFDHITDAVGFILKGAKDSNVENKGNALFPAILRSELHEVRSVIEEYSNNAEILGSDESDACGIVLSKTQDSYGNHGIFRVTTDLGEITYRIDRWD